MQKPLKYGRYGIEGRQKGAVKIFSKCCKRALLSGTVLQLDITHKHINLLKHSNTASVFVSHIHRRKLLPIDFQSDYSKRFQSYTSNFCLSLSKYLFTVQQWTVAQKQNSSSKFFSLKTNAQTKCPAPRSVLFITERFFASKIEHRDVLVYRV